MERDCEFLQVRGPNLARFTPRMSWIALSRKFRRKLRKVQVSKLINELEERNKHAIDNTKQGADHRAGIYYWVNKVTHAQVFNHGKHLMFDVIVPEPAATFKKLFELKIKRTTRTSFRRNPRSR